MKYFISIIFRTGNTDSVPWKSINDGRTICFALDAYSLNKCIILQSSVHEQIFSVLPMSKGNAY